MKNPVRFVKVLVQNRFFLEPSQGSSSCWTRPLGSAPSRTTRAPPIQWGSTAHPVWSQSALGPWGVSACQCKSSLGDNLFISTPPYLPTSPSPLPLIPIATILYVAFSACCLENVPESKVPQASCPEFPGVGSPELGGLFFLLILSFSKWSPQ